MSDVKPVQMAMVSDRVSEGLALKNETHIKSEYAHWTSEHSYTVEAFTCCILCNSVMTSFILDDNNL